MDTLGYIHYYNYKMKKQQDAIKEFQRRNKR